MIVGSEVFGWLALGQLNFGPFECRQNCANDVDGYLVLKIKNILKRTIEPVGPDMRATVRVDELSSDANARHCLADAAFQHVANTKLSTNLSYVELLAFVKEAGIACDYEKPLSTRERGYDVFDHPVSKVVLLGIAAHVLEWQHGDRRLVGKRQLLRIYGPNC